MFPKRDVITLGTGGYMTGDLVNERFPSVNTYLQNFMDLPVLRPRLEGGRIVSWGLHLEYDEATPKRTRDGLILTGEAGGFVMPFLGEGMPEAFFTGIYAAQAAARAIAAGDLSGAGLLAAYDELLDANLFMKAFRHVAARNKASNLAKSDEEIAAMMQSVVMAGGFITNAVHTGWLAGADDARHREGAGGQGFPGAPAAVSDDRLGFRRDLHGEETKMKLEMIVARYPGDTGEFLRVDPARCTSLRRLRPVLRPGRLAPERRLVPSRRTPSSARSAARAGTRAPRVPFSSGSRAAERACASPTADRTGGCIMASRDTVMETLRAQNARFAHEKAAASFKGWTRVMRYDFPDIGLSATITVTDGVPAAPVECDGRPGAARMPRRSPTRCRATPSSPSRGRRSPACRRTPGSWSG